MNYFNFIDDMIHMTPGEQLIEYWWLWLIVLLVSFTYLYYNSKKK